MPLKNGNTLIADRKIEEKRMTESNKQKQERNGSSFRFTLAFLVISLLLSWFICKPTYGQNTVINVPQSSTFQPVQINQSPINNANSPASNPNRQLNVYEQDKRELQKQNAELSKTLYGESEYKDLIQYNLPSQANIPGAVYFRKASEKLNQMLSGEIQMNLKQAIFETENAYLEGKLNYQKFDKGIQNLIEIARLKAVQDGYNWKNPQTRNIMLFRVMADTLKVKLPSRESYVTSYPMRYDFDDYMGKQDWSNMFVTKLLASKSGQCHSLPLLYLILCEETGTKANLAFSPSHSYAKFKDQSGNWHNLELTNGHIVSDAFIIGSGYITAEALKNRIYMEPLSNKQTIGQCLADLGKEYAQKYGYDSFVSQCIDSTLKYNPTNIFARQVKSDYQTLRFNYVVNQVGRLHPDTLKIHYPKVYQLLKERNQTYQIIDASGYQEMPEQAYREWLKSVDKEEENEKREEKKLNRIIQIVK